MATERRVSFLIGANAKQFYETMSKTQRKFRRWGRKMKRMGGTLSRGLTMPIGAAGASSIKMAMDFEKSMTKIQTLVGLSADSVDGMKESVLELSNKTGKSAKELSEALFVVTSAGLRGKEAMAVLEQSAKASAMGLGQTKEIARTTTAAINAYGKENLSASKAADQLTAIVREGNLEAEQLSGSLGKVLGPASQLGVSLGEVGGSIATYTRLGVSAEEATTGLRAVMNSLIKTTPAQKKAFQSIGTSAEEVRKKVGEQGLAKTMRDLIAASDGNISTVAKLIPNVRALSSVLGTAGAQGEEYANISAKIAEANGLVNKGFEDTEKTASQKLTKAFNKLKNAGIQIGTKLLPVLNKASQGLSKVATWFGNLSDRAQYMTIAISGIVAAIGPLLIMLGSISAAIGAISLPVVGVIAAFGALSGAILYIVDNWKAFKERFSDLSWWRNAIIDMVQFMIEYSPISAMIKGMNKLVTYFGGDPIPNPFQGVADKLDSLKTETKEYEHSFGSFSESIKNGFSGGLNWVTDKIESLGTKTDAAKQKFKDLQAEAMKSMNNGQMAGLPGGDMSVGSDLGKQTDLSGTGVLKKEYESVAEAAGYAKKQSTQMSEELANRVAPMVQKSLGTAAGSFVEMASKAAMSGDSLKGAFKTVLTSLADLAIRVGKIAIGIGIAIEGIKKALQSLNPAVALAAGVALVAVGSAAKAALSNAANKGGSGDDSGGSDIPRMASGGIIPSGYPNDSYPAMLSSGERVVPPKDLDKVGGGGASEAQMERAFGRALSKARLKAAGSDLALVLNNVGSSHR